MVTRFMVVLSSFFLMVGLVPSALKAQGFITIKASPFDEDLEHSVECRVREHDDELIETDRHDFTQTPKTVGKYVSQLEFGYSFFYKDDDDEIDTTHTFPELALRYGITEHMELKIRWNYALRFGEDDDLDGAEDMRLAVKIAVLEQERWIPETALQFRGSVPTGGNAWTTDNAEPGINLIYAWELGERVTLSGSTGVDANGGGDVSLADAEFGATDNFNAWHQSVALGMPISERNTAYFEWFGIWTDGLADEMVQHYVNIGIDHLLTNDLVIDFRIGKGLSNDSEDLFVGVGGGMRF